MKQNMKRLWLMVCVAFSLLALTACSAAETETEQLEEELEKNIEKIENLLSENTVPPVSNKPGCKKCAYYEYCYI